MPSPHPITLHRSALALFSALAAVIACGGGVPSVPPGAAGTAQALVETAGASGGTALAGFPGTATVLAATIEAGATELEPTAKALATQLAGAASTAATALAQVTPPAVVGQEDAATVMRQYAQEVLGLNVTIIRAGGLTADIQRQIKLPQGGESAQGSAADAAVQTYAALFESGAGSVSYGSGTLSGDLTIDINSASLGAFSFDGGPMPKTEAEALALALEKFPGLAGRTFTAYPIPQGFAWSAQGNVPGYDLASKQAALVAEEILLAVTPGLPFRSAVSAVVGKGVFAADVLPGQ